MRKLIAAGPTADKAAFVAQVRKKFGPPVTRHGPGMANVTPPL